MIFVRIFAVIGMLISGAYLAAVVSHVGPIHAPDDAWWQHVSAQVGFHTVSTILFLFSHAWIVVTTKRERRQGSGIVTVNERRRANSYVRPVEGWPLSVMREDREQR